MTNSYQSFQKDGTFDPVQVPDISKNIDESLEQLRRSEQQNVQDAYVRDKSRADNLQKAFEGFGQVSGKLGQFFQQRQDEYRKKETARMEDELYAEYLLNPEGFVRQGFEAEVDELKTVNVSTEQMSGKVFDSTKNYETAVRVKELSGWHEIKEAKIRLALAKKFYDAWLPKQLLGLDISDQASRGAAISQARTAFMKEFNLLGYSNDLLGTDLYPGMTQLHDKLMTEGAVRDAVQLSDIERQEAYSLFESDFDLNALINTIANTTDDGQSSIGRKAARGLAFAHIRKMFKVGNITQAQLDDIRDQPVPGQNTTFGKLFNTEFDLLEEELTAEQINDDAQRRAEKEAELNRSVDRLIEEGYPSMAEIEYIRQQAFAEGIDLPRLNNPEKITPTFKNREKLRRYFNSLIPSATLSYDMVVDSGDATLIKEFGGTAKSFDKGRSANNGTVIKDIEGAVDALAAGGGGLDKTRSFGVEITKGRLVNEFNQRLAASLAAAESNGQLNEQFAETEAIRIGAEVVQMFADAQKNPKSPYYYDSEALQYGGAFNVLAKEGPTPQAKITNFNQAIDRYKNNLTIENAAGIISREQYQELNRAATRSGFQMPPLLTYAAQRLGMTPFELFDKIGEVYGIDSFTKPPIIEVVEKELSNEDKQLLYTNTSPERSARGLSKIRGYNPAMVPHGFGEAVQSAATKHNIPPAVLAALLEVESGYRLDVIRGDRLSSAGAIGIAQFMPGTADELGIDPLNTDQAIEGAARYLRQIMDGANQTGAPVDLTTAIYMYNAGPYRPKYPWGTENRNYYPKVLTAAMKYGNGAESLNDPALVRPSLQGIF